MRYDRRSDLWFCDVCGRLATFNNSRTNTKLCGDHWYWSGHAVDLMIENRNRLTETQEENSQQ